MLFLFDIDGTLLRRMPPVHREAIREACHTVFEADVPPEAFGRTAGMTDTAIFYRMLSAVGVVAAAVKPRLPELFRTAADVYDRLVPDDLTAYHTPHAAETVAWLADRGAALGLVTGNIQRIAWRKLASADLAQWFKCGAFGDEAESRDELPPRALARAREVYQQQFPPERVYIVGDTPADIGCGAAAGLRTIGVATGPEHSYEHLQACSPDFLVNDLRGLAELTL